MARYTGPKSKISRRFGVPIFGPSKALERKNYGPGMHGPKGSRRKTSEYALALAEKQKLRHIYGVMEKQFRRFFEVAANKKGVTGTQLLQMLELRLRVLAKLNEGAEEKRFPPTPQRVATVAELVRMLPTVPLSWAVTPRPAASPTCCSKAACRRSPAMTATPPSSRRSSPTAMATPLKKGRPSASTTPAG